ncbi:MAG: sugar nucleotide-binding protein [Alphaproteobacteria bacterium]|nr:sugar nucleotide-binding protein [Alphaproteobacteria bacterium]
MRGLGRLLLVGGDGMIGRHLASGLRQAGWQVTATSRRMADPRLHLDLAQAAQSPPSLPACEVVLLVAAAEQAVLALGRQGAVLRLSKVVAPELALFAGWAAALRQRQSIAPFADMYMAPVPVVAVTQLVHAIAAARSTGIHQLSGDQDRSYALAAQLLARALGCDPALVRPGAADPVLHPAAALVRHSTLDMARETEIFGVPPPEYRATLAWLAAGL